MKYVSQKEKENEGIKIKKTTEKIKKYVRRRIKKVEKQTDGGISRLPCCMLVACSYNCCLYRLGWVWCIHNGITVSVKAGNIGGRAVGREVENDTGERASRGEEQNDI